MRSKLLQIFFSSIELSDLSRYHYRPSNLDFDFDVDGLTLSRQFDIVGYNSQFNALSFSLTALHDAGIDISSLKGINPMPFSSFKSVSMISNSDSHE